MSGGSRGQDSSVAVLARFLLASFGSVASLSRAELEERTGLSRHVVADIVAELLARGELVETRHYPPPEVRGRPPVRYARAALQAPVLLIRLRKEGLTSVTSVGADGAPGSENVCAPWSASWEIWSRSVADASEQVTRPRLAVLSVPFPVAERRRSSAYARNTRGAPQGGGRQEGAAALALAGTRPQAGAQRVPGIPSTHGERLKPCCSR